MCAIMCTTLEGLMAGDETASALEEARSKLLLLPPTKGLNLRVELATRLRPWQQGAFHELLV